MVNKLEIQVFVSCPGDVEPEKKIVEAVCKDITESVENHCKISFRVKEWKSIVGQFGERLQGIVNEQVGVYDIYLGIWWMRFGSKTGATNPHTGEEFESGTHEEFIIAYDSWKQKQNPKIFLFFKDYRAPKGSEIEQLGKLNAFKESQQMNGWLNTFDGELQFQRKVYKLLNGIAWDLCYSKNVEEKRAIIEEETVVFDFQKYRNSYPPIPEYINRSVFHFGQFKKSKYRYGLEAFEETLIDIVNQKKRIVLLGDAGSGKSTELKYLAYHFDNRESPYFPIYQQLNTYTPERGLESFLPSFWSLVPKKLLLIIWDGLDEIQPKDFNTVTRQINSFSEQNPDLRILISSRSNFYQLPENNSTGTLKEFEPYFIADFTASDVKKYYDIKFSTNGAIDFLNEVNNQNLNDLVSKPFFLMALSNLFKTNGTLDKARGTLFEAFILSRIDLDEKHFQGTFDIRAKKIEILKTLERTALSMEVLARNQISENELLSLLSSLEFETLKFCTAFKKKDGEDGIWQFEHNNIQEYLAAKALAAMDFKSIMSFITFAPKHNKLIPSWSNTLTFLFSLLEKDSKLSSLLIQWLVENEKEVIVKFEKEKLSEDLRSEVFVKIFNHYKNYDVWINSNKFSDKELAKFAQSKATFEFLKAEIANKENSRITKINAINITGHLKLAPEEKAGLCDILLSLIDSNINDSYFIFSVIHSLSHAKINSRDLIESLMGKLREHKNQYVRASMYSLLLNSDFLEYYVDYLIEGLTILNKKDEEREEASLFDETWNLRRAISSIKSPNGIKVLLDYISKNTNFFSYHGEREILESIISNASEAHRIDNGIFNLVLKTFVQESVIYRDEWSGIIESFFNKTRTRELAFKTIWEGGDKIKGGDRFMTLSKLATEKGIDFIIEKYNNRDLTNHELDKIYNNMRWVKNPLHEYFVELVNEKTTHKIQIPPIVDYESIQKSKLENDFSILFNKRQFEKETIEVFDTLRKDDLTYKELYELNVSVADIDEKYPETVLRLLRDFIRGNENVSRSKVEKWFKNESTFEWYLISLIHEYVSNDRGLIITTDQINFIKNWTLKNALDVRFKEAITVHENGSFNIQTKAIIVAFFTKKFDITHPKSVLLDMLSFDYFESHEWVGFDHLIEKLPKVEVDKRVIANLKEGIPSDAVLKNHTRYAVANLIEETYELILLELLNQSRSEFFRNDLLDIYFEGTNDSKGILRILPKFDSPIRWHTIEKLTESNEKGVIVDYLLDFIKTEIGSDELLSASKYLIKLQNLEGLALFVKLMREGDGHLGHKLTLNYLQKIEAVPYLIELLEISYQKEIKNNEFENLNSAVLGSLNTLALRSEENFTQVVNQLTGFMNENTPKYKNVNFLLPFLERLENQFYMNKSQTYTITQLKEKMKLISP